MNSDTTRYDICPICSSPIKNWRQKNVGGFKYQIDSCIACGYAFVNPRPSLKFLMDYYSSSGHGHGHEKSNNDPITLASVMQKELIYPNSTLDAKRMITAIMELVGTGKDKKILDVGCGYGFFSKAALDNGFIVTALELASIERSIASELLGVEPIVSSFENFDHSTTKYDVLLMSQILEHAQDINLWIEKAHALLENNGIFAIALPNFGSIFTKILKENDPYVSPPAHLNFFNADNLSKILVRHGFDVEKIQWVSRIPAQSFNNRLPSFGQPLLPAVNALAKVMLKGIDVCQLGMMVTVYSRKRGV